MTGITEYITPIKIKEYQYNFLSIMQGVNLLKSPGDRYLTERGTEVEKRMMIQPCQEVKRTDSRNLQNFSITLNKCLGRSYRRKFKSVECYLIFNGLLCIERLNDFV